MKIEYAATIPERAHILHVGLRTLEAFPVLDALGKPVRDAQGNPVTEQREVIHECPVRKSHYEKLTAAQKLTYVCECEKWHHKRDATVRAKWDADDKAKADAAAAAAKAAEEAKFIMTPAGFVKDKDGAIVGVQVTVTHQGHTCPCVIANDAANAEENARAAWQVSKDKADVEKASLAAFGLVK